MARLWGIVAIAGIVLAALWGPAYGETIIDQYGGTYANWGTVTWQSLVGLNDIDNGASSSLDFVGDSTNGGAFWGSNDSYLFFRMRVDRGTITSGTTWNDTLLLMVDRVGVGTAGQPDYAFAYDTVGTTRSEHGMEMTRLGTSGATWSAIRMDDIDNNNNGKIAPPDFRTTGGDGYIRTVDSSEYHQLRHHQLH